MLRRCARLRLTTPLDTRSLHMAAKVVKSTSRLVIFGGSGFVGSAIAREAVRRGLDVTCLSRGGAPPSHAANEPWTARVTWAAADALDPSTYAHHFARDGEGEAPPALVTSIGRLPLPGVPSAVVIRDNGDTNVVPAVAAAAAGVTRLVVIGAAIPPLVPGLDAYRVGKELAFNGAKSFAGKSSSSSMKGAVVLQPGGVSGTRYVNGVPLPLWAVMSPVSAFLRAVAPDNVLNALSPTPIENVARAAVDAATDAKYAAGFTVLDNAKLIRLFNF